MKKYLVTNMFVFLFMTSQSQTSQFDSIVNKLQFHIFTDHPDTCVLSFLKRCVPVLSQKLQPTNGSWTMYPPGPIPTPQDGMLSIKLPQHPSLFYKHCGTRFDILTQEWESGNPGIKALRVWFYFDKEADAKTALNGLI